MHEYMDLNSPDKSHMLKPRVLTYGLSPEHNENREELNNCRTSKPACSPPYRKVRALR